MFDEVIKYLALKAENAIPPEEGDYYEKELLMCGKCHTAKECLVVGQKFRCMCSCMVEAEKKEEHIKTVKALRELAFPDDVGLDMTFQNDDVSNPQLLKVEKNYVENFGEMLKKGQGLLLYGSVGTGKTFAACSIANALIEKEYRVHVSSLSKMIACMFPMEDKQAYIDSLRRFQLLVLDDLGVERKSEYMTEQVYNIINARYETGLPTIITTNLSLEAMTHTGSLEQQRIYDRIIERCFPVEVKGVNHRRKAVREGYGEMKNLLGIA